MNQPSGSPRNGSGTNINAYDEYGIPASTNIGRFQYTGQIWLPDLGMYHYKARVYSPTLGRMMQTDPIGYQGGMNLHAYVLNDPVNFTDPSGMCSVVDVGYGWYSPSGDYYSRAHGSYFILQGCDGGFGWRTAFGGRFMLDMPIESDGSGSSIEPPCDPQADPEHCAVVNGTRPNRGRPRPSYCSSAWYKTGQMLNDVGRFGQRMTIYFTAVGMSTRSPGALMTGVQIYNNLGAMRTAGTFLEIIGGRPVTGWDIAQEAGIRITGLDALGQVISDVTLGAVTMNVSPPNPCR